MRKQYIGFVILFLLTLNLFAQKAILRGNISDEKTGETIVGASVILEGTTIGAMSDFDGNFEIKNITPGTFNVICSFISYKPGKFENVVFDINEEKVINFKLGEAVVEVGEVKVVAKVNRESETLLLLEQKQAIIAQQAIGAHEISRKGASDAEAAVTKVSGVSKQEGVKNVFVRGLGDRYNFTTFNGYPVTSEDPEYKNISLDFFASDMIKAIGVKKVFNAPSSGDVGGAEIDIASKELSGSGEFNLSASAKANTRSLNVDFWIPDGVNTLGFGENTNSPTSEESYNFKNALDPDYQNFQLGKDFGFSGGKKFDIHNKPLKFYFIGSYSGDYSYSDGFTRETTTIGTIFRDQNTKKYEQRSSYLAMANVNYQFNKNELTYNALFIHTAIESLRDDYGKNAEVFQEAVDNIGLVRRQQNNLNTLVVNQVDFKKEINRQLSANAGLAYNYTNGKEPDRRVNYLSFEGDNIISPLRGSGRQHRYYSELNENDLNVIAKVNYNFNSIADRISSLDFGYKGRFLYDKFVSNSWDNSRTQSTLPKLDLENFSLDSIFNQNEFEARHFKNDEYNISTYTVNKIINSIFSELNYQFTQSFILNVGVKADFINLNIDFNVNDGSKRDSHSLSRFYILPNLNLKYTLNEKNTLRFGASRSYTLPQSKEISPLLYEGPQWSSQGNPDLVPSVNYNVDIKWDLYLSNNELFSVTTFGKLIRDPLSKVEVNSAGGFLSYANIANEAKLAGIEVEFRKNLFSINKPENKLTNKLSTGINFSYLTTGIVTNSKTGSSIPLNFTNAKTQLEGASPVIANGDITYNYRKKYFEITASVIANYVSKHIYSIGVNGFNDINESSRTTLDFVSSIKINQHWGLSLKAKNLLDPEYRLTREPNVTGANEVVLRSYQKGVGLSFGLSYNF